ncbi:hypothetical protein DNJ95_03710 [Stutzerimonas kirkiae]|uniref:Uncharacterized protein n=1 Tax=Stutzerimonas kirkiae TaxID=2211392 RepID=A0A4Q9RFE6_9GAMM|nr:hypothetical protein DNJ96_00085 [Stutzerimonas kirkiae]TBV05326.1 hypothetical protein DNJ95_03710 [Stutzerimonas kirkiae]TBV11761.1 hypothetical protein DNK08_02250 [Stutzerimonas kirkiae]
MGFGPYLEWGGNMQALWVTLGIICLGMLLLGIGFTRRDTPSGIALLWVGTLCMLSVIGYRILEAIKILP